MVKKGISITLDEEVIDEVKDQSKKENRSLSYVINEKLKGIFKILKGGKK